MNDAIIHVVDDDPAVRDALAMLLEQHDLRAQTWPGAAEFLQGLAPEVPGCIVADVRMPGMDGLELQQELVRRGVSMPLIILTGHGDIPMSVRAMRRGAVDFLTKPVGAATLLASVREALDRDTEARRRASAAQTSSARLSTLTAREREVMDLAVKGLPNKEIARRLGISHRTVEIHRARLMQKTGAQTIVELVHLAAQPGS
jgi:RNA polymerase sigma factor (sigma-70 family)